MSWRKVFREIAEGWNWTPEQVGSLTYYQARMMMGDKKDLGGTISMSVSEAQDLGYAEMIEARGSVEDRYGSIVDNKRSKTGKKRPVRKR